MASSDRELVWWMEEERKVIQEAVDKAQANAG
jgi:hypothetical protein